MKSCSFIIFIFIFEHNDSQHEGCHYFCPLCGCCLWYVFLRSALQGSQMFCCGGSDCRFIFKTVENGQLRSKNLHKLKFCDESNSMASRCSDCDILKSILVEFCVF